MGEKNENSKIGIMIDREFKEISQPSLEIDLNLDMGLETELAKWENSGFQFAMNHFSGIGSVKALERYGIYLISNNWRKLHGLPMRRRCK